MFKWASIIMIAPLDLSTSRTKVYAARVEELADKNRRGITGDLSAGMELSIKLYNTT
jgi:hypothetical protein